MVITKSVITVLQKLNPTLRAPRLLRGKFHTVGLI